jgi:antitoxin VapB
VALSIKDPEADRLARDLAQATGETLTEAVLVALRERLARQRRQQSAGGRLRALRALQAAARQLPVLDPRPADDILGYGEDGLPR